MAMMAESMSSLTYQRRSHLGNATILLQKKKLSQKVERATFQRTTFKLFEKEAFAIQFGTQHFRVYLVGRKFTIITDHSVLKWLNQIEPKGRVSRWLMDLQEFDFVVKHRPGRIHNNADALSRPFPSQHKHDNDNTTDVSVVTLSPDINIRDAQRQDHSLAKLRDWKSKGLKCPPKIDGLCTLDPYLHKMLRFYDRLFLREDILVRAWESHPQKIAKAEILLAWYTT